jgi:FkbM family methyltransferase
VTSNMNIKEYRRDEHASIDESKIIISLLQPVRDGIVIDVGAHYGDALKKFAEKGYTCYAFEPDPVNREKLLKNVINLPVIVDPRAISNAVSFNQPFYRSPESTGISSLTSFRKTHSKYCCVNTTTIESYCREKGIDRIDFLKIDTEGYDLMVLKGVPWDRIIPLVILCEFEDLKTVPLGYDFHQMAQFLQDKGYSVYVSEWHPIVRYGISHDWKRFTKYPCELSSKDAWGNLLAFKNEPLYKKISYVVNEFILAHPDSNIPSNAVKPTTCSNIKSPGVYDICMSQSPNALANYANIHKGQRCVIIGNGPSLNKMDLSFLENEISFGTNRIYLLFEKWKFRPTYYVSVNPLVIKQSIDQISRIPCPKFLGEAAMNYFHRRQDTFFLKNLPDWSFSKDPKHGVSEGWTVTYVAMQLAYYMGFSEINLIGVDHRFVTQGAPNKEVVSQGNDPNHFHPDYFGKGTHWHLPDLGRSEKSYRMAKQIFEADGRKIIDATVDGELKIFPKVDYRQIFFPNSEIPFNANTSPQNALNVLHQAQEMVNKGLINAAIDFIQKSCREIPNDASLHFALGLLLEQLGEKRVAISYFEAAVQIESGNINYLKKLAFCYHKTWGRSWEALNLLRKVLAIDDTDVTCYQAISQICQSTDRMDDASYFNEIAVRLAKNSAKNQRQSRV